MPNPPNSQVFGGKRAPDDHFALFSVTACHRRCHRSLTRQPAEAHLRVIQLLTRQPAELVTTDVTAPLGSVFWYKKRSKRSSPKSPFFVSDCKWDAQASKFAGCSVFRFRAGKAANSSPPSMSPLVTASSPLSLGPKSAQEACETSSASMGLQILVDPASSHMLVSKPKKVSGSIPPGSASDHPSRKSLPGAGLVRAWCGPGAGLAILRWAQDCSLNPALATGLLQPFLRHTQDCPDVPQQPVHVWS